MSYLLDYKGVKILAKSADEAVELARKLADERVRSPKKRARLRLEDAAEVSSSDQAAIFWRDIEPESRQVLAVLAEKPDGMMTDDLAQSAHVKSENLKYVLRKIHTKAKLHGLDGEALISSERVYVDRLPKSRYRMKDTVRKSIQSIAVAKEQK
jgi:hypothetical protein